jgi:hypothetical protein
MSQNKTQASAASVDAHLAAIENDALRADAIALVERMSAWTAEPPLMWGPSIVGFGSYHYRYDSGREGDACATGMAARRTELVVYLFPQAVPPSALLARLGKHKLGKSCLYIRRLADVDMEVLESLVKESLQAVRQRYGDAPGSKRDGPP